MQRQVGGCASVLGHRTGHVDVVAAEHGQVAAGVAQGPHVGGLDGDGARACAVVAANDRGASRDVGQFCCVHHQRFGGGVAGILVHAADRDERAGRLVLHRDGAAARVDRTAEGQRVGGHADVGVARALDHAGQGGAEAGVVGGAAFDADGARGCLDERT